VLDWNLPDFRCSAFGESLMKTVVCVCMASFVVGLGTGCGALSEPLTDSRAYPEETSKSKCGGANGCGPSWGGSLVPESIFAGKWRVPFTPSCNIHDTCYGSCTRYRYGCDVDFQVNLAKACDKAIPKTSKMDLFVCYEKAIAYFTAVRAFGGPSFLSGQACSGCSKPLLRAMKADSAIIQDPIDLMLSMGIDEADLNAALPYFIDQDDDLIPDQWEQANGLDPNNPADAEDDPDGDGLSNLSEYLAQLDPFDADSDHNGVDDLSEVLITNRLAMSQTE
jgi:Group XII secretory phospholipase A2 precursor (PLA2G12)